MHAHDEQHEIDRVDPWLDGFPVGGWVDRDAKEVIPAAPQKMPSMTSGSSSASMWNVRARQHYGGEGLTNSQAGQVHHQMDVQQHVRRATMEACARRMGPSSRFK